MTSRSTSIVLPPEVLSEIFLHYDPAEHVLQPSLNTAPLLLGSICNRWGIIALSTLQLLALPWGKYLSLIWYWRRPGLLEPVHVPMNIFLLHCEHWYGLNWTLIISLLRQFLSST